MPDLRPRATLVCALLVTAFAAAPAASHAADLTPRALYGGGSLAPSVVKNNSDVQFTSIRVSKTGKTINFFAEWQLRCPGLPVTGPAYFVVRNVAVKKDGTFSGRASLDSQGAGGSQTGSVTVRGRFGADGVATGTGRGTLALKLADGRTGSCAQNITWRVLSPGVHRAMSPFAVSTTSYGTTSQTYPAMLRTARSGRSLTKATLEYDVKCTKQAQPIGVFNETMPGPIRVGADGRFKGTERFEAQGAFVAGTAATVDATLTGRFGKTGATGTWRIRVALRDPVTNAPVDTCDSGPLSFRVER